MAVVLALLRRIDADRGDELDASRPPSLLARTVTLRSGIASARPSIEKVSSPVRPSDAAVSPAANSSGRMPMPTRLLRWMRS